MGALTERDKEVLEFIKKYMKDHNTVPTIREIGRGIHMTSTSTIQSHMKRLECEGELIRISDGSFRYSVKGMRYIEDDRDQDS